MFLRKPLMRQALLAALAASLPVSALAEVAAQFHPTTGNVLVSGISPDALQGLVADEATVRLMVAGQTSTRSMPLTVSERSAELVIAPRFSLKPGTNYTLALGDALLEIAVPAQVAKSPMILGFAPSQAVIPANILRLYITFSEPMARGQLRENIQLVRTDGTQVASPFLNLETELWDADQRRATLLLDPGRIKQGVGPNAVGGAPLQEGESYRLIVSDQMESAAGFRLVAPMTLAFRVGPPERREIDPAAWDILTPGAGTLTPLSVAFDRIMDSGAVVRFVALNAPDDARVRGDITTDGGGWSISPSQPWATGPYQLIVDPELEDISGNTPSAPFDAKAGTIGTVEEPIILTINIAR